MNTPIRPSKRRRRRGVILTATGLERLKSAKADAECYENRGQRYTLEALSERTGVGIDTLAKVLAAETRVDKQTLKACFSAFELALQSTDYYSPDATASSPFIGAAPPTRITQTATAPPSPGGPLPIDSPFYMPPVEAQASSYEAIDQPGALLRIRGPQRAGKSSLMARIAQVALQRGYQPVSIRFQLAEKAALTDLDQLLQWFCVSVGREMEKSPDLGTYWNSLFGSKVSCKAYFEEYLLAEADRPVVLLLDDVDRLFRYPDVADEFFGLLRTWYEEAKTVEIWQRIRLVIAQPCEVYIPLTINKSPFNVGLAVSLSPLTPVKVQSLALAYGLRWSLAEAGALCQLLGGQPYLSHLALDHFWRKAIALPELLANPLGSGIFASYLQLLLQRLQSEPHLCQVLQQILNGERPNPTMLSETYQLQSMGLVTLVGEGPQIACPLFQAYFGAQLLAKPTPLAPMSVA
ncbi:MAG: AAA-like domain-containing protein [Cyanobacteria bacterium J06648_16]